MFYFQNLAAEKTYNDLDVSLRKANEHRNEWFEGVQCCNLDETLYTILERIVRAEVHRLVVVDENRKVIGIISLSDILLYLVLRPSGEGMGGTESSVRATDPKLQRKPSEDDEDTTTLDNKSPSVGSGSRSIIDDILEEEVFTADNVKSDKVNNNRENEIVIEEGNKSSNDLNNQAEISFADEAEEDPEDDANSNDNDNVAEEDDDDDDAKDVISGNCDNFKKSSTTTSTDETSDLSTVAVTALKQTPAREMALVSE